MEITYASAHRWRKDVVETPLNFFGKSEQIKLKGVLEKLQENKVRFQIEPLDEYFFDWWLTLYNERVRSKDNPQIFNVKEKTLGNADKTKQYFSLTLLEAGEKLGGVIFSLKESTLFFAYRTFKYDWKEARLRASPSLLAEYLLALHAKEAGMKNISHGKDKNPYGLNSGIGLASFKLSVGCFPQLVDIYEVKTLDTDQLTVDTFVLECPKELSANADITKAFLVADDAGIEKWRSLQKYPERLKVEIINRNNFK